MRVYGIIHEVVNALADFLFPPACAVCGSRMEWEDGLCGACRKRLTSLSRVYEAPERTIGNVDSVTILLPYIEDTRQVIHGLKYHGMPETGIFLGKLLAAKTITAADSGAEIILVPIPLHPLKLRERGYNQSERIARGISEITGLPVAENIVRRTRHTGTQTSLTAVERSRNVAGVFTLTGGRSVEGAAVVIVDDVLTTGATVSDCARVIREGGASSVHAAVASTPSIDDDFVRQ